MMWAVFLILVGAVIILNFAIIKLFLGVHNANTDREKDLETEKESLSRQLKELQIKVQALEVLNKGLQVARSTIYRLTKELEYKEAILKDIETKNNALKMKLDIGEIGNKINTAKENNLAEELNRYNQLKTRKVT